MGLTPEDWQALRFTLLACGLSTVHDFALRTGHRVAARRSGVGLANQSWKRSSPCLWSCHRSRPDLILLKLLGRRSSLGGFLHRQFDLDLVFTWRAVVIAAAVMSFPLLVRSARVGFQEVNRRYEEMARTLGAGEWRVFTTISLPLASRGILAGVLLAFARAVGEFGATILVAGNIPGQTTTLSLRIYEAVQLGHDATAYRLLLVCVLIAFATVFVGELLLRRRNAR